jgi:hypothetical protein
MILWPRRAPRGRYPDITVVASDGKTRTATLRVDRRESVAPTAPRHRRLCWLCPAPRNLDLSGGRHTSPGAGFVRPNQGLEAKVVWGETDIKAIIARLPRIGPGMHPDSTGNHASA